jgi:ferredoxin
MPQTDSPHPPDKALISAPAPFEVRLIGAGGADVSFAAPATQTVLQSALAAGYDMLSACRNGTCRACLRQLHTGQVSYKIAWPGLSAEEKAEGFMLPCVAHPESDLVIQAHTN